MKSATFSTLLLLVVPILLMGQAYAPKIPTASKVEVYKTIGDTKLKAWIFEPFEHQASHQKPAIVFFFGGGWSQGSPAQFTKHCEYLAGRGMVAITVDYRVFNRQQARPRHGVEDAKSAIRWVRQNARRLGVDPDRIVAAGGSSGGHLAASTATLLAYDATNEDKLVSSKPNALALFNPVLVTADIPGKFDISEQHKKRLGEIFEASPASLSPAHHLPVDLCPSILFHGTEDKSVPYQTSVIFHDLATANGSACRLVSYEGEAHGFFNYGRKNNGAFVHTIQKLDAFFVELGYLEKVEGNIRPATLAAIGTHFSTSTPEQEGISSASILSFLQRAEKEVDALHSFMIIRNGKKVSEGWWSPYAAASPHVMHSLSKSFTSTAIGLLVKEGKINLNDKVLSFFPEYAHKEPSYQWQQMRIRDLLTMNTGHIEEPTVWFNDGNWVEYFMQTEVPLQPGTHFKYNSPATYMLSAIVQKITGELLVDYLTPRLFEPLKIKKPHWDVCPNGINTGGWGLSITTEDIAKLGQLYLQKGQWNGQQLISAEWAEMATSKQVSNGSDPDNDWNQGYGFQFWQCRHGAYRGDGAMGQYCIVIPEKETIIAITSGVYDMGKVMTIVWEELLPALQAIPLKKDIAALEQLQQKTAKLQLPIIQGDQKTKIAKKVSRKKYTLQDNEEGIRAIDFDLHKRTPQVTIQYDKEEVVIPIGQEQYHKSTLKGSLPYGKTLQKKVAANGAWVSPNEYQLRIYFYEMPERITYNFIFDKEQLTWKSKLDHSLLGPNKQADLFGSR